jgi:hypothetical protein
MAPRWLVVTLSLAIVVSAGGLSYAVAHDLGPFQDDEPSQQTFDRRSSQPAASDGDASGQPEDADEDPTDEEETSRDPVVNRSDPLPTRLHAGFEQPVDANWSLPQHARTGEACGAAEGNASLLVPAGNALHLRSPAINLTDHEGSPTIVGFFHRTGGQGECPEPHDPCPDVHLEFSPDGGETWRLGDRIRDWTGDDWTLYELELPPIALTDEVEIRLSHDHCHRTGDAVWILDELYVGPADERPASFDQPHPTTDDGDPQQGEQAEGSARSGDDEQDTSQADGDAVEEPELGRPSSFELFGPRIEIDGAGGSFDVTEAQLRPSPVFPSDEPLVYIQETTAVVNGSEEDGLLVLSGDVINVTGPRAMTVMGSLTVHEDEIQVGSRPGGGSVSEPEGLGEWEAANRSAFFAEGPDPSITLENATFSGFDRGLFVGNATVDLDDPVSVQGGDVYWGGGRVATDTRATIEGSSFALHANVTDGRFAIDGEPTDQLPQVVDVRQGTLAIEPGRVATEDPTRIDQAVDEQGPMIPAEVDIQPSQRSVTLSPNETKWISFDYEETTREGAAVLEQVEVDGDEDRLKVPLKSPPGPVERMVELVDEGGIAAPFIALAVGLAAPFVAFAEALSCLFGCWEPNPYPSWMAPGDSGTFHVEVKAPNATGTYTPTIVVEGANYADHRLDVQIDVESPDEE